MGWCSATGLVQYLHRRMINISEIIPPELELRRDRPPPTDPLFAVKHFYQVFIDNFDEGNTDPSAVIRQPSAWTLALRKTGEKSGVLFDDGEKRVKQSSEARTIGADRESLRGAAWPLRRRAGGIAGLTFALLSQPLISLKPVEVVGGIWVHLAQFRRQLMAMFAG